MYAANSKSSEKHELMDEDTCHEDVNVDVHVDRNMHMEMKQTELNLSATCRDELRVHRLAHGQSSTEVLITLTSVLAAEQTALHCTWIRSE